MKLEIVKTHDGYAIRNAETKNYLIPWGLKTIEQAEEALQRCVSYIAAGVDA